jgi:hypothetical protein
MQIRIHRHHGNVLLASLVIAGILGAILAAYLSLANFQNNAIARSQLWNVAISVAESGIEEALTQLNFTNNLASSGWDGSSSAYTKSRTLSNNIYISTIFAADPNHPYVISTGLVKAYPGTNYISRVVKVTTDRFGMFIKGMVAKGQIDLRGNNINTDSFDSRIGSYAAQAHGDQGDVATNSGLTNSFSVGNANIHGHASTGPGGSMSIGPNGGVGSHAWQQTHHGFQEGWTNDDMNVYFPDVPFPYTSGWAPTGGGISGVTYAYILGADQYYVNGNISLNGQDKLLVTNRATLVVNGNFSMSGNSQILVQTNASLKLYVNGSAAIAGNGVANNNASATNFFYYGLTNNTSLSFSGNGAFKGVIYAPNAAFDMNGGGNSVTNDFTGASVSSTVNMNGHFNFHYDISLGDLREFGAFQITSWSEL